MPYPSWGIKGPELSRRLRFATHTGPCSTAVCPGTPCSGDRMAAGSAGASSNAPDELGPAQPGNRCCCSCCPGCCCGSLTGSSWRPCSSCSSCRRESRGSSPLATTPNRWITDHRSGAPVCDRLCVVFRWLAFNRLNLSRFGTVLLIPIWFV